MQFLRRPRNILFWLRSLVAVVVLPPWLVTAGIIGLSYERERATVQRDAIETARALMQAVDSDLASATSALRVLATSPYLMTDDLAAFHRQARQVLESHDGNGIVLANGLGEQVLSTLRPYGEGLPPSGVPGLVRTLFDTGRPMTSDFYIGATSRQAQVAVGVPVLRDGKVVYALTMGLLPARLAEILRKQSLPRGWITSIFDSTGTIVARTDAAEKFVGQPGAPGLLRRMAESPEGAVETETLEGIPVLAAFSRSAASGWTVAIGIPRAELTAQLRRSMLLAMAGAGGLFLLGLLLARAFSLRIARSIGTLSAPALALASGIPLEASPTEIVEVNEVETALQDAARLLAERTAAREAAERAERTMGIAKEAAERSSEAKSEFLAMMSHELRTPLHGILGFAQLIDGRHYGPLTDKQKEFIDAILFSGNHLLELINDVLELSKIESGRMTVSMERVEIVPVMKSVLATLGQAAAKAGVALRGGNFGASLPPVHADRVRLAQCLLNLGTNAIKYNRREGSVTFSYGVVEGRARISVTDTGRGIPQNRQAELFEPFNRLGAERTGVEGTGVGLTLTRRLVELMGGKIGFVSTEGQGSCFWIDFPIYVQAQDHAPADIRAPAPPWRGRGTVLYIEDNPSNLLLMRNIIATLPGVRLIEATSGAAGLAAVETQRPDIVIVDIDLPDINGFALLKQVRGLSGFAQTPILALSASALPGQIRRGLDAGFFTYLTKPIDVGAFLQILEAALTSGAAEMPAPHAE